MRSLGLLCGARKLGARRGILWVGLLFVGLDQPQVWRARRGSTASPLGRRQRAPVSSARCARDRSRLRVVQRQGVVSTSGVGLASTRHGVSRSKAGGDRRKHPARSRHRENRALLENRSRSQQGWARGLRLWGGVPGDPSSSDHVEALRGDAEGALSCLPATDSQSRALRRIERQGTTTKAMRSLALLRRRIALLDLDDYVSFGGKA